MCLATAACLSYGGVVVMFWLHAVARPEQGPAISDQIHWLLDSTLAFVGLLPAVLAIVPVPRSRQSAGATGNLPVVASTPSC